MRTFLFCGLLAIVASSASAQEPPYPGGPISGDYMGQLPRRGGTFNAQFKAEPPIANNYLNMECVVTKIIPPDHDRDPGYKVNLVAEFDQSSGKVITFDVTHTTTSGKKYRRSDQYENGTLTGDRNRIMWAGWRGTTKMVGMLQNDRGRWLYIEQVGKNGRVETTINTVCHQEFEAVE